MSPPAIDVLLLQNLILKIAGLDNYDGIGAFLIEYFTADELKNITLRIQIASLIGRGYSLRAISNSLNLNLSVVARQYKRTLDANDWRSHRKNKVVFTK